MSEASLSLQTFLPVGKSSSLFKSASLFLESKAKVERFPGEENLTETLNALPNGSVSTDSPETARSISSSSPLVERADPNNMTILSVNYPEEEGETTSSETTLLLNPINTDAEEAQAQAIKSYLLEPQVLEILYKGSRSALKNLVATSKIEDNDRDFDKHGIDPAKENQKKLLEHTFLQCLLLFQVYWQTNRFEDALRVFAELENLVIASSPRELIKAANTDSEDQAVETLSEQNIEEQKNKIEINSYAFLPSSELTKKLKEVKKVICDSKIFEYNESSGPEEKKLKKDIEEKDRRDQWNAWIFDEFFVLANLLRLAVIIRFNRCFQAWEELIQSKSSLAIDDKSRDGFHDFSDWFNNNLGNEWVSVFWIVWYLPRFFVNLCITAKHTFAIGEISDFEKKLSWDERLAIQLRLRGSTMANDFVWAGDNALCWVIAHGMVTGLGPEWAMFFIVLLYIFDVINAYNSYRLIRNEGDRAITEVCLALREPDLEEAKEYKDIVKKNIEEPEFFDAAVKFLSNFFRKIVGAEPCKEPYREEEFENVKVKLEEKNSVQLTGNQLLTLRIAIGAARESRKKLVIQGVKLLVASLLLACMITAAVLSLGTSLIPTSVIFALKIVSAASSILPPLITFSSIYLKYSMGISPIPVGESSTYHKHNKHTFFSTVPSTCERQKTDSGCFSFLSRSAAAAA